MNSKEDLNIICVNTRGIKSKVTSIADILKKRDGKIACFQETCLKGKEKIKIKGFQVFNKNRDKNNSGVITAVDDSLKDICVKVGACCFFIC